MPVVEMGGKLTLGRIDDRKVELLEHLAASDKVVVHFLEDTEADVSFLQMICAAHKAAVLGGKTLTIEGHVPPAVDETVEAAGFSRHSDCPPELKGGCVWQAGRS